MAAEIGSYGAGRLAAGGTVHEIGGGDLTVVAQSKVYDGPWRQPERLRHYSGFAKFERPTALGELELSGQGYRGKWRPTEQIPERLIGSSLCADAFCSPDPTATGQTTRLILNAKLSGEGWKGALYAQHYDWDMYSNPTYANADASSAQIHQFDRRQILGFRADRSWRLSDRLDVAIGTENRFDRIGKVGVVHTDRRVFIESYGLYRVHEGSASIYGEATLRPVEGLRITAGLRGDAYRAKVDAKDTEAAALGVGKAGDEIVSPKFGAAYKLSDHVEVYGNWGVLSTENLTRSESDEVAPLLNVIEHLVAQLATQYRVKVVGDLNLLPEQMAQNLHDAEANGERHSGIHVNVAIAYGGRHELRDAVRSLLASEAAKGTTLDELAETLEIDHISDHLYTAGQPDPDLIIRTSGEQRMSGFLIWQSAHSEFYFCEAYWPDFRKVDFLRALRSYGARGRRFGS